MAEWGLVSWAPRSATQDVSRSEERRSRQLEAVLYFIGYVPFTGCVIFTPMVLRGAPRMIPALRRILQV